MYDFYSRGSDGHISDYYGWRYYYWKWKCEREWEWEERKIGKVQIFQERLDVSPVKRPKRGRAMYVILIITHTAIETTDSVHLLIKDITLGYTLPNAKPRPLYCLAAVGAYRELNGDPARVFAMAKKTKIIWGRDCSSSISPGIIPSGDGETVSDDPLIFPLDRRLACRFCEIFYYYTVNKSKRVRGTAPRREYLGNRGRKHKRFLSLHLYQVEAGWEFPRRVL